MKKGFSSFIAVTDTAQPITEMLTAQSQITLGATPTWAAPGATGYEFTGANPDPMNRCIVAYNMTLSKLFAYVDTAVPGGITVTAKVYKSTDNGATWTATTLTCNITAGNKQSSDIAHNVSFNAGDLFSVEWESAGGPYSSHTTHYSILETAV